MGAARGQNSDHPKPWSEHRGPLRQHPRVPGARDEGEDAQPGAVPDGSAWAARGAGGIRWVDHAVRRAGAKDADGVQVRVQGACGRAQLDHRQQGLKYQAATKSH